jgi:signal transduction histidine kinase
MREGSSRFEWIHKKISGEEFWTDTSLTVIPIGGKNFIYCVWRDITDRKRAEEELRRSHEQPRILSTHINKVREEERARIAREMHDELGQMLTTLNMDISWIKKRLPSAVKDILLFEKAEATSILVKQAIKRVQKVSAELRPVILDDFGLVAALEWAVDKFKKQTGIDIQMATETDVDLNGECSTQIYRIVQESLTNVARHASATKLVIYLKREDDNMVLEINDNGRGISDEKKDSLNSFGILGMRERAVSMGGEFTINGIRGKGTTVRVKVPITGARAGSSQDNQNS